MRNGRKNGESTQFSDANQPSSEAKSKGWARRRARNEFMDLTIAYQDMTVSEFEEIVKDMESNGEGYSIKEAMAIKYMDNILHSDKFLLDWVDRHIGKPSTDDMREEKSEEDEITGWTIEIIDKTEDVEKS